MSDLIDRQAAIDAVNSYFGFSVEEEYGSAVQEVINGLPSVQSEPKWIPVTERLPEYETDVLVTVEGWYKGKLIDRATDLATYWQHGSYIDNFETLNDWIEYGEWKVTAWMPLPKPYREETGDGAKN